MLLIFWTKLKREKFFHTMKTTFSAAKFEYTLIKIVFKGSMKLEQILCTFIPYTPSETNVLYFFVNGIHKSFLIIN